MRPRSITRPGGSRDGVREGSERQLSIPPLVLPADNAAARELPADQPATRQPPSCVGPIASGATDRQASLRPPARKHRVR